ncbi:hypothetical protein TNCV_2387671 [Trichonephila clavipes]|nr:hypothetical protein TNCV_2387671 [Trichonephila clavipes]
MISHPENLSTLLNEELPVGKTWGSGSVPTDKVGGKRTIEEGNGEPAPSSRRRKRKLDENERQRASASAQYDGESVSESRYQKSPKQGVGREKHRTWFVSYDK